MRISPFNFKRLFIVSALLLTTILPSFADENLISQVVISKSKDKANSYELSVDSTQMVQYKSRVNSDGNVIFDLRNSILASNMGTIYDDVVDIDNVTVKQLDNNRVRIYVNGQNAKNTDLVFVNAILDTQKSSKKVTINRPISEYKSTSYVADADLEFEQDAQEWDDNSFNLSHLSSIVLSELKNGPSGKILILLSLFAIMSILIKTLASKVKQDREPLIGLNSSKYLNNNVQIGSIGTNVKMPKNNDLASVSNRNETLKQAQAQLASAHQKYQQYIQNKYQGAKPKSTVDVDALKKSIALNQYQKSTQNPYKNQEVIKMNKRFSDVEVPRGNYQIPPRPKTAQKAEFTSPYIRKTSNFVTAEPKKEQANMKFLESVTKIYERSGRADLADGLKNSMSKAKQTI